MHQFQPFFYKDASSRVIVDASLVGCCAGAREQQGKSCRLLCQSQSESSRALLQSNRERSTGCVNASRSFGRGSHSFVSQQIMKRSKSSIQGSPNLQLGQSVGSSVYCHTAMEFFMCLQGQIQLDLSRRTKIPVALEVDEYVRTITLHATPTALRIVKVERISAQIFSVTSSEKFPHRRKMGQCPEAELASAQRVDLYWSCTLTKKQNCCKLCARTD